MKPPKGTFVFGIAPLHRREQTLTWRRRNWFAVPRLRFLDSCGGEDRRRQIDDVARLLPQLAAGGDTLGPMNDQRGADTSFVIPNFVPAKRRVRDGGPAWAEAQMRSR